MRRAIKKGALAILGLCLCGLTACNYDAYEAGEGQLSMLVSEFVEAQTKASKQFVKATTDANNLLIFSEPLHCSWAITPDSTYRAVLFYKKDNNYIKPIAAEKVYVLPLKAYSESIDKDPIKLESAWVSASKSYLNIRIALLSGKQEKDLNKHEVGVMELNKPLINGKHKHFTWQLTHRQNNIPQFVSSSVFVSVPLHDVHLGDTLTLQWNDYKGAMLKQWVF